MSSLCVLCKPSDCLVKGLEKTRKEDTKKLLPCESCGIIFKQFPGNAVTDKRNLPVLCNREMSGSVQVHGLYHELITRIHVGYK